MIYVKKKNLQAYPSSSFFKFFNSFCLMILILSISSSSSIMFSSSFSSSEVSSFVSDMRQVPSTCNERFLQSNLLIDFNLKLKAISFRKSSAVKSCVILCNIDGNAVALSQ